MRPSPEIAEAIEVAVDRAVEVVERAHPEAVLGLAATLALNASTVARGGWVFTALAHRVALDPDGAATIAGAVDAAVDPTHRVILDALRAGQLDTWALKRRAEGLEARPLLSARSEAPRSVQIVVGPVDTVDTVLGATWIGWWFEVDGVGALLALGEQTQKGRDRMLLALRRFGPADAALIGHVDPDRHLVVGGRDERRNAAAVEEAVTRAGWDGVRLVETTLREIDVDVALRQARARAGTPVQSSHRVALARAIGPDASAPIADAVSAIRETMQKWTWSPTQMIVARIVPDETIRTALGIGPDGALPGAEPERLSREPAAALLLSDAHPVWRAVPYEAPIYRAVEWAEANPGPGADSLLAAWRQMQTEHRWLHTFPGVGAGEPDAWLKLQTGRPEVRYAAVLEGLREVFDPRASAAPLAALDVESGMRGRLLKLPASAFDAPAGTETRTLAHLPRDPERLLAQKGFGDSTLEALGVAVGAHLQGWRAAERGAIHGARRTAEQSAQEKAEIGSALDDLADLLLD
jgi:hypothetical protein